MKAVLQRVSSARVQVDDREVESITQLSVTPTCSGFFPPWGTSDIS